jgi:hypothetical protein
MRLRVIVQHLGDRDAAADEVLTHRVDVVHDEHQVLSEPRSVATKPFPNAIEDGKWVGVSWTTLKVSPTRGSDHKSAKSNAKR